MFVECSGGVVGVMNDGDGEVGGVCGLRLADLAQIPVRVEMESGWGVDL